MTLGPERHVDMSNVPAQPPETEWAFVKELQAPLWSDHGWRPRGVREGEADLSEGVTIASEFPDPEGVLTTAHDDLRVFLAAGGVRQGGRFVIRTAKEATEGPEAFTVTVAADQCCVEASDTEGVRRGLFVVEEMMCRACGPFLPLGRQNRRPFLKNRISRCFFGPIKRPPRNRDELTDDVDYYPDNYLNRLAHEAVNGLWLTIEFRDLCKTSLSPEYGGDRERRLDKLRRTVAKCRRHGIRVFVFCIEPRAWESDDPVLARSPEMGKARAAWDGRRPFCPFSDTSQKYLYESVHSIFAGVPHLGGLINISHGERCTTCLSLVPGTAPGPVPCPVCSTKEPWEILAASLTPMVRAMKDVDDEADLISWLYMPYEQDIASWVYDIPVHTPDGVILQFNFESGVQRREFGRTTVGGDYWLSEPGPSPRFERIAEAARQAGTAISAKIQTSCSHEVATAPFVPVPGLLYRKFKGMRDLGVSSAMLCWYFGNYPGLMGKASGKLAFEPFPETEDGFLHDLAAVDWGPSAEVVAEGWRHLSEGYRHFPLVNVFQYYGPMHDGPAWPLLGEPADARLFPTWQLASARTLEPYPPSGDRFGEAFAYTYSLAEVLELCGRMTDHWDRGVAIWRRVEDAFARHPDRMLDIGVARALGVQFRSGFNILRFYELREKLFRTEGDDRLQLIESMKEIAREEVERGELLLELCSRDSRLGFHSEAEGYKYFPDKIRWRLTGLERLLTGVLPSLEAAVLRGEPLFPEYTGQRPEGPRVHAPYEAGMAGRWRDPDGYDAGVSDWQTCEANGAEESPCGETHWALRHDDEALYLLFRCDDRSHGEGQTPERMTLKLEPRRLWPCLRFAVAESGDRSPEDACQTWTRPADDGWKGCLRVPFTSFRATGGDSAPVRIDVQRIAAGPPQRVVTSWMKQHRLDPRLRLGDDNPADLGWLVFGPPPV